MTRDRLLWLALVAVEVAAVGLAVRAKVSRPLLALLALALVDELAVEALHVLVFADAPRPRTPEAARACRAPRADAR